MDMEGNGNFYEGVGGGPVGGGPIGEGPVERVMVVKEPKKSSGWRIFWGIFISLSVLANVLLFFGLIAFAMFAAVGVGSMKGYSEEVIRRGPHTQKIAVINLYGMINNEQSKSLCRQITAAGENDSVKGLIIHVNSPGGSVSSSDQIYNAIMEYRKRTGRPVVSFMGGIAASGGYYASVACDRIICEPTTITGSIGVILGYLVVGDMLEEKLGIQPVVVKSGPRKDWPSSFTPPTEEQLDYLKEKLIGPAYKRFVKLVDEGRENLSYQEVKELADGSIYYATEAVEKKLVDRIGYLDDAIGEVMKLAGIESAQVFEYKKIFSFSDVLGVESKNMIKLDRETIYELNTPELMYLWQVR